MAYGTVTVTRDTLRGRTCYVVTFSGTALAAATEATISGLPTRGRIYRVLSDLTPGAASTTVDPIIGNATAPANNSIMWEATTAADPFSEFPAVPVPYYSSTGILYYRDRPNGGGTDSATLVVIYILPDWED
jgi:hypothetical protein